MKTKTTDRVTDRQMLKLDSYIRARIGHVQAHGVDPAPLADLLACVRRCWSGDRTFATQLWNQISAHAEGAAALDAADGLSPAQRDELMVDVILASRC